MGTLARKAVVVRVGSRILAIPIERAIEIMRPLPVAAGSARIRGERCPVIDARRLLAIDDPAAVTPAQRYVMLRGRAERVALVVDAVLGVGDAAGEPLHAGDPARELLGDAGWLADAADSWTADEREKIASGVHVIPALTERPSVA